MGSIANGRPPRRPLLVQGVRSVGDAEDIIAERGYDGIEFGASVRPGYVNASSYHTKSGKRAQAHGRNRELAAQSLVRTITRR